MCSRLETCVIPCETYHIRLVVADAGDNIFDSAVFLEANSFTAGGESYAESVIPGTMGDNTVYEGCGGAEVVFKRWGNDWTQDLIIDYTINPSSTATEGVDFSVIPSPVTIPAGQGSITFPLTVFEDFITEGVETIIFELESNCACSNPTLEILINDMIPLEVAMDDVQLCGSGDATLVPTVSGGVTDYTYLWSDGSTDSTLDVSVTQTENYTVTVSDVCGSTAVEIVEVLVTPIPSATISGNVQACAEAPNAQLQIDFTGVAPWSFSYTLNGTLIGPITTSDNPYFLDINTEGTFVLTDVNVGICEGAVDGSVTVDWLEVDVAATFTDVQCYEVYDGTATAMAGGAIAPYSYNWSNGNVGSMVSNLPPGMYTVTVTDALGCTDETMVTITQPPELTASAVQTIQVDCNNPFGAADLTLNGGTPIYDIFWDNGSTDEDPNDLFSGDNNVMITDANGCTVETSVFINEDYEEPIADVFSSGSLDCINTTVNLDASNSFGNGTLTFEWYDNDGIYITNTASIDVTTPGLYLVIITDSSNGCVTYEGIDVFQDATPPTPLITADGIISCVNGSVTLDGSGSDGTGNISYQWQNSSGGNIGSGSSINVVLPDT